MGIDLSKAKARLDAFRKQAEERKNRGEFLDLKEERDYLIRILPPVGNNDWCIEAYYHYNVKKDTVLLCPKETYKTLPCPVCEFVEVLFKTKDKDDRETAFKMRAKIRVLTNALSLDKGADGKPKIFAFGPMIYQKLLEYVNNDEYGDITDPVKGFDLKITRTGKGQQDTKYSVMAKRMPSGVANYQEVMTQMVDLGARTKAELKTYEQLKAILEGTDTEPVAEDGEVTETDSDFETPAPQTAAPKTQADDGFGPAPATVAAPAPKQTAATPEKALLSSALDRLKKQRMAK